MMRRLLVACVVVLVAGVVVSLATGGSRAAPGRWVIDDLGADLRAMDLKDLNERGEIIGEYLYPERAVVWRNGNWTDLGMLRGMTKSKAVGINDRGQIIGQSCTGLGSCAYPSKVSRAFVWANGKMTDLGTLGGRNSRAWDLNNKGEIVGSSDTPGQHVRAVLWRNGKLIDLGTLGGKHSGAVAINERSQVVGWSETSDRKANPHLFLWSNRRMTDLGIQVGRAWWGHRFFPFINERGHIAGYMKGCGKMCGFLWHDGELRTLNLLEPLGINNRDEIPAWDRARTESVVWRNGTSTRFGRYTDYGTASRRIINERGQIIAAHERESIDRPFVWENGKRTYLPVLDLNAHSEPVAINNSGQIIGSMPGSYRVVLWTWQRTK